MKNNNFAAGHTDSYYAATANPLVKFPTLEGSQQADVCVVGGGYTGLSSALHLAERGFSVIVLEAERVGWGASGRNGGHVGTGQRKEQQQLEKMLGFERAKTLWDLGLEAVTTVTDLVDQHQIECDLKSGNIHVAAKASHTDELRESVQHLQQKYNYHDVSYIEKADLHDLVGSEKFHGGLLDKGAKHLHPLNYALGLANAAAAAGVAIYENSRVTAYDDQDPVTVSTEQGEVKANFLVLGCNGYLGRLGGKAARKIMPINNFVLATEPLSEEVARKLIRDDTSVADSMFVVNYWKLSADNRLIFGGGENYTSKFPADIKSFVRKYMLSIYPQLERTQIDYAWGGTLAITLNRLPHLARLTPNHFIAQGYSGHGVPTATMAGKLIAEAIAGEPERFDVMAALPSYDFPGGTLLRWPGLVAGMLYYGLMDRL